MVIRTKNGGVMSANGVELLDFLGVRKEAAGVQKVAGDVALIASVPFITNEKLEIRNEKCQEGEGQVTGRVADNKDTGVPWTFSTFDLDRYGERIDPAGWDFKRYRENPVVEWAHRYDIPAIGKAEGLFADGNGLHGVIVFNDKSFDPFGWSIGERVKAGVIRAGSVGFRVMEIEIPSKDDSRDGTCLIFRKQELLEFSICNVPANPFALAHKEQEPNTTERSANCGVNAVNFLDCFLKIQHPC